MAVAALPAKDQHAEGGDHADRQVDVEHPAPVVVVGQPAAQHRAADRPEDRADAAHRHRLAMPLERVDLQQHRLRQRHQPGAANPLQPAIEHELGQAGGAAAQSRGHGEARDREHEHDLDAEAAGEPAGQRHHDRRGDDVGGQHPGDLILRGRQAAADVRQRHVGDRGVEPLHDVGQHDRDGQRPAIGDQRRGFAPHRAVPGRPARRRRAQKRAASNRKVTAAFSPGPAGLRPVTNSSPDHRQRMAKHKKPARLRSARLPIVNSMAVRHSCPAFRLV